MINQNFIWDDSLTEIGDYFIAAAEHNAKVKHPNRVIEWCHDVVARKYIIDEFSAVLASSKFKTFLVSQGVISSIESDVPSLLAKDIIHFALFGESSKALA